MRHVVKQSDLLEEDALAAIVRALLVRRRQLRLLEEAAVNSR